MNQGDKVNLGGFEPMALINYAAADSKVAVVHNHSTHVLIFRIDGDGLDLEGTYVAAYRYSPGQHATEARDFGIAYRLALEHAIGMAIGERSDET